MSRIHLRGRNNAHRPETAAALDWSVGAYEQVAAFAVPAAEAVLRASHLEVGEQVVDVGCGSGTLAILAAAAGARVAGVDPAHRLLDVARAAARRHGHDIEFVPGAAEVLPLPDDSQDAVLSDFGVIFARNPDAAIAEMIRVLKPSGRIVFSAWLPDGLLVRYASAANELVSTALGSPSPPAPFPWHDLESLRELLVGRRMTASKEEDELVVTAASPEDYLELDRVNHPMAVIGYQVLRRAGVAEAARARLLQLLREGNEDDLAFRSTNRYAVLTLC